MKWTTNKNPAIFIGQMSKFILNSGEQQTFTISLENSSALIKIYSLLRIKLLLLKKSSRKYDLIANYPALSFKVETATINYANNNLLATRRINFKGRLLNTLDKFIGLHSSLQSLTVIKQPLNFNPEIARANPNNHPFIFIFTSNPTLLFINKENQPEIVISIAQGNPKSAWEIKKALFNYLPNRFAQPIKLVKNNEYSFIIEQGLDGSPWFQILSTFPLEKLLPKALNALQEFQCAINQNQAWHQQINLKKEFTNLIDDASKSTDLNLSFLEAVKLRYLTIFNDHNSIIKSAAQHSDFSVNNLLFKKDHAYIIDLEDFGRSMLPLQDEMSLAISFYLLDQKSTNLPSLLQACIKSNPQYNHLPPEIIKVLFICQLLFKLGSWSRDKQRYELRLKVFNILKDFLEDENKYVDYTSINIK
ncbi:hypothetical protein [Thalassomonas sp. M1454]|uniref:hypothetical protein n=1 Tax=Thalassomonas sp. M1454 TaxID=2594477 RepID=UPI00117E2EF4|nr:hypothetical protein [Thalassomonas sp. M1454]TRX57942.1 hypothetical protein FNN08_00715 [Thalassomonas sp. M1454]